MCINCVYALQKFNKIETFEHYYKDNGYETFTLVTYINNVNGIQLSIEGLKQTREGSYLLYLYLPLCLYGSDF